MNKPIDNIFDIKHTFYINLEHRVDRKKYVEKQLNNIGISSFERFNAINLPNGRLGCSMSHLKCLEYAKKSGWGHLLIVEDDITFLDPPLFQKQLNIFLSNHKSWDVLLIGGNVVPPYQPIDSSCIKVMKCQTTTGYIVRSHYFDSLMENIRAGMNLLLKEPGNHILYAIDKYWFKLQEKDLWYLIIPLTVTQREDYSDIEKRQTNYSRVMTDLDKPWLQRI